MLKKYHKSLQVDMNSVEGVERKSTATANIFIYHRTFVVFPYLHHVRDIFFIDV